VKFPKFEPRKPREFFYIIKPKPQKKKGIFQRFKDVLNKPIINNKQYYDVYGNTEEDEDDAFTEEENEDLWQF
jgi:hypothetical protein